MTTQAPNSGDPGVQPAAWAPTEYTELVTAKGWKGPGDALKSYTELETFRGAPADRLLKIPDADKIDDAFRGDVFKRIGYTPPTIPKGPDKPEDYGLSFEGAPPEFATGLSALAHKHGISVEAMKELSAFNTNFGKEHGTKAQAAQQAADEKTWGDRHTAVEGKLKERFGDKYAATSELMTREAMRVGFKDAAGLEAFERNLALGDENDLGIWRSTLADLAEARREGPLHKSPNGGPMSAETAKAELAAKRNNSEWVTKALTRGTPEAEENIRLNVLASGGVVDEAAVRRQAKGLAAEVES
jgi:hypothetical protein